MGGALHEYRLRGLRRRGGGEAAPGGRRGGGAGARVQAPHSHRSGEPLTSRSVLQRLPQREHTSSMMPFTLGIEENVQH